MPRRMIGERPMTVAERVRRHRALKPREHVSPLQRAWARASEAERQELLDMLRQPDCRQPPEVPSRG
jgi:hypothetical protein